MQGLSLTEDSVKKLSEALQYINSLKRNRPIVSVESEMSNAGGVYLVKADESISALSGTEPDYKDCKLYRMEMQGTVHGDRTEITEILLPDGSNNTITVYNWSDNVIPANQYFLASRLKTGKYVVLAGGTTSLSLGLMLGAYLELEETQIGGPSDNAVQTLTVTGSPSGGTFYLKGLGTYTTALAYNASAATIETALESLYGVGNVSCTGGPINTSSVVIEFVSALANTPVDLMEVKFGLLTGGNAAPDAGEWGYVADTEGTTGEEVATRETKRVFNRFRYCSPTAQVIIGHVADHWEIIQAACESLT